MSEMGNWGILITAVTAGGIGFAWGYGFRLWQDSRCDLVPDLFRVIAACLDSRMPNDR